MHLLKSNVFGSKRSAALRVFGGCSQRAVKGFTQKCKIATNAESTEAAASEHVKTASRKDVVTMTAGDRETRWQHTAVEVPKKDVVTRRRVPPNFVKDVLMPHLERWIWKARTTPPWYLMELIVAYSQMPVINASLAKILSEVLILRLEDFNGPEFVKMLLPLYRLRPEDLSLFAHISVELEEHFYELTTLNLIAIVRVYARLPKNDQQTQFLESHVIPRLQSDIARYDTEELSALLLSLASLKAMDVHANVPLLAAIVPQIERRYDETPLLTSIINVNALCRLRVYHKRLVDLLCHDLSNPYKIRNLPPKYVAMALWTFTRYGVRDRVLPVFTSLILDNVHQFSAREFARLAQCLPADSRIPLQMAVGLLNSLPEMPRKDFPFYVLGCVRRSLFPAESNSTKLTPFADDDAHWEKSENSQRSADENAFYVLETQAPQLSEQPRRSITKKDVSEHDSEGVRNIFKETKIGETPEIIRGDSEEETVAGSSVNECTSEAAAYREILLAECLQYARTYEYDIEVQDIMHIGRALLHTPNQQYAYISKALPSSWEIVMTDVMAFGK